MEKVRFLRWGFSWYGVWCTYISYNASLMYSLYHSATSWWFRIPRGPKIIFLLLNPLQWTYNTQDLASLHEPWRQIDQHGYWYPRGIFWIIQRWFLVLCQSQLSPSSMIFFLSVFPFLSCKKTDWQGFANNAGPRGHNLTWSFYIRGGM